MCVPMQRFSTGSWRDFNLRVWTPESNLIDCNSESKFSHLGQSAANRFFLRRKRVALKKITKNKHSESEIAKSVAQYDVDGRNIQSNSD